MDNALLITKLHIPSTPAEHVIRERLFDRLNEGLARKLTLVSAPAGFGKTTLLSVWASRTGQSVAWLSFDDTDNDFPRFIHYITAVLQSIEPNIGGIIPPMLQVQPLPSIDAVMTSLINGIAGIAQPVVLVLDDYHVIDNESIHLALQFLLDHMPPHMHLIISTRADPPLSLARLRARRQIVELREADLRFTPEESAEFLTEVMGLELTPSDISVLDKRTEGWIAGLQIAAISMRGYDNISDFIRRFSGSHEYIVDYLTDEVLSQLPDDVKSFLLKSSILNQMSGPLCEAVTGQNKAQQTLEQLHKANLFVIALDTERQWYRYHRLFVDLLQQRLSSGQPEIIPILHQRASEWYENQGHIPEAVHHALASADYRAAADLIEHIIHHVADWLGIEASAYRRWLDALPPEVLEAHPWLKLYQARVLTISGQLDQAQSILEQIEQQINAKPDIVQDAESLLDRLTGDQISLAMLRGDLSRGIAYARQALTQIPATDPGGTLRYEAVLAMAYSQAGNVVAAKDAYQRAIEVADQLNEPTFAIVITCGLAGVLLRQGQLRQAEAVCQHALQQALNAGEEIPLVNLVGAVLAKIQYERDRLDQADAHIAESLDFIQRNSTVSNTVDALVTLARIRLAQGDQERAQEIIEQAVDLTRHAHVAHLTSRLMAYRARLWLATGDVDQATRWAEGYQTHTPTEYLREIEDITAARVMLKTDQIDASLRRLDTLLAAAESSGRFGSVIEILVLQSLAHQREGDNAAAMAALERALALAEPEGFRRVFLDEGEPMTRLLQVVVSTGGDAYARELLATADKDSISERRPSDGFDPLTDREVQVLRYLDTELTVPEIADALFISTSTARSHIKSIYSKLNVHSRYEAVVRAQELDIL